MTRATRRNGVQCWTRCWAQYIALLPSRSALDIEGRGLPISIVAAAWTARYARFVFAAPRLCQTKWTYIKRGRYLVHKREITVKAAHTANVAAYEAQSEDCGLTVRYRSAVRSGALP
jgi:hypothetical protein